MSKEKIAFRAVIGDRQKFITGGPISFDDGSRGIIRKIIRVEHARDGRIYVIGQYTEEEAKTNDRTRRA
jgi:hypothetical protein